MRYFATAIPGVGPILGDELAARGFAATLEGSDGRNDLVSFEVGGAADPTRLRTSEDVYVELARARRASSARGTAERLVDPARLERALSVYARWSRPLATRMTYRVVARVRSERGFTRAALRSALSARVAETRPRWRPADPAGLELWAVETRAGSFLAGLRLTGAAMRHRGGRAGEREGALRPTIAAALVLLAGEARGTLLDPACGSGTVLSEAIAAGWAVAGADLDPAAVALARTNAGAGLYPSAVALARANAGADLDAAAAALARANAGDLSLWVGDVRRVPLGDSSVGAVASNLPFGKRFPLPGSPTAWHSGALAELARVVRPGGSVSLLVPPSAGFERALAREGRLALARRYDVRLLGMATALWHLRRRRPV